MKIAIIHAQFNDDIGTRLLKGAVRALEEEKIKNPEVFTVPGSLELAPYIAHLANEKKFDGFIALGAVIKGETHHFESVCEGTTFGLQKVAIECDVPVMNGVLMCYKKDQALARSKPDASNKGYECAKGVVMLVNHYKNTKAAQDSDYQHATTEGKKHYLSSL